MCTYQDIDATIVRVVRQSLLQHLWYLTEHFVIPAFFMSLQFLVWRKLWLHKFICILQYLSMLSRLWEIHGDASLEHAKYLVFIWMTCNITNYSLMSLNVTIIQPITFYILEQYSIPLKPVLGGLIIVALSSTLDKQRICENMQLKSLKKQLKWNVCVPKSNSNDRYAITCDVIAYHLVHFVSIRLINKCQSGLDFIFTSERAIYSSFMKISVPSPVFFVEKH